MPTVAPGATFEAFSPALASGLAGTVGVRIRDGAGADFLARATAGISVDDTVGATSIYRKTLTAPTTAGQYWIVWDTGAALANPVELVVSYSAVTLGVGDTIGLTTLQALRLHVLRDSSDDSADEKLTLYGEMMSERVTEYCQRQFLPDPASGGDAPVDHLFAYDGGGSVDLSPYELRASEDLVVKLYTDRDASLQQTVPVSNYKLSPRGATRQGTYLGLDLQPFMLSGSPFGFAANVTPLFDDFEWQITVTGRWGMAAVPRPVELAVLIAVDAIMVNPGSMASQDLGGYTIQPQILDSSYDLDARGGLPRDALFALAPYRRRKRVGSIQLRRPNPVRTLRA